MKLNATAMLQSLEKIEEAAGEREMLLQLRDFASSEFAPARGDGSVLAEAVQKELDFGEREVHLASKTNQKQAIECVAGIAALAADAFGRG
jgi:hypothetical protein